MKIFLSIFFILPVFLSATIEDAQSFADEQIKVFEAHMMHCEEEGYNNNLVMDYQYHNGYVHGARDAYKNMLKKIEQN